MEEDLSFRVWKNEKAFKQNYTQNDMHKFLEKICEEAGPREPGGFGERKAAKILKDEYSKYCDKVSIEKFPVAPLAFLSFTVISPLLILAGVGLFWFFPIIPVITIPIASLVFYLMFLRYTPIFDIFFPRRGSYNVIGEINPQDEWKQTVLFSGHLDSAYQFNLNRYMPKTFSLYLIGYPILVILFFVLSLVFFILKFSLGKITPVFLSIGIPIASLIVPMSVILLFFKTLWPIMGAMDNLSGIAITQGIAVKLKSSINMLPKHTKVLLVGFGSEEAGLRGSKAWVKRHKNEYSDKPFYHVNFDTVAKCDAFHVINRELTMGVKFDPKVIEFTQKAAKEVGVNLPKHILPFGATDAAALVQGGFKQAATIEALDLEDPSILSIYHTVDDTADEVEPKALEIGRDIALEFLKIIDNL